MRVATSSVVGAFVASLSVVVPTGIATCVERRRLMTALREGVRCGTTHHHGRKVGLTSQINEVLSATLEDVVRGRDMGLWDLQNPSKYGYFNASWCNATFFDCLFENSCRTAYEAGYDAGYDVDASASDSESPMTQFDALAAVAGTLLRPSAALRGEVEAQRRSTGWPNDGSVVAVHLRRGDKYGDHSKGAKKQDFVSEIDDAALADAILDHAAAVGAKHVAVASDDAAVVRRLEDLLLLDRERANLTSVVTFGPRPHAAGAALPFVATLFLLAEAGAFVGNFDSNVSRLLALLIGARIATQPHCDARPDLGYPRVLDLDGLIRPADISQGRYFCTLSRVTRRTAQLCHHASLLPSFLAPPRHKRRAAR